MTAYCEFPQHLLRVPGFVGEVMKFNLDTSPRPQPILALAGALSLQAVLCGRKVRDAMGNRSNVYCVSVARSGTGKDHARKVNRAVLAEADALELEGHGRIASEAGLMTALQARPALLFQLDEMGRLLSTSGDAQRSPHSHGVVTAFLTLYSAAGTCYKATAYADPKQTRELVQPCVVIHGTTTPGSFFGALNADSILGGMAGRLLVFESTDDPDLRRVPEASPPESVVLAAKWWKEAATSGPGVLSATYPRPRVVPADAGGEAAFDEHIADFEERRRSGCETGEALWSRAFEKASRLALVYACSRDREHPVIDAEAARWACQLVTHLTERMVRLAEKWISDGPTEAKLKRMLREVEGFPGAMTKSDLTRKTQWLTRKEREEMLATLVETGRVKVYPIGTATKSKTIIQPTGQ